MSIGDYKNKLAQDLEYWKNVNDAKRPDQEIIDMVPSLSDEEKSFLPNEVVGFYNGGRWFWNFIGCVALPYIRVAQLFNMRHISDLFKAYIVSDDHDIPIPMADETFDLLKYLSTDAAREICLELCEDRANAENLMNSVIRNDLHSFTTCFAGLSLPDVKLKALTKTINTLKQMEFFDSVQEVEEIPNMSMLSISLKGLISDVSFEKENGIEASNVLMDVIDVFHELVEEKHNENLNRYICESYPYQIWVIIAKRLFCPAVYAMRRIWDSLTPEEKDVANEILNPDREMTLIINGERTRPTQHIIDLALRWSKISRKKVLERDNTHYCLPIKESDDKNPTLKNKTESAIVKIVRLPFPSRIINNKVDGILSNRILQAIFKEYGHFLTRANGELITEDEFVYMFSGRINRPNNYNPPYYWSADKNIFAGLIRLLYDGQEKGFDTMILLPSDIGRCRSSIKWSTKKQGLGNKTLAPIENTIQAIVEDVAGKRLREVDLTRQRVKKKDESTLDRDGGVIEPE